MKRNTKHNIGSISSGTMRPEDLISAFLSELRNQRPLRREHLQLAREIERQLNAPDRDEAPAYFESDVAQYHLEDLFEALNEYAPAYFYFGANPGDGADYGYWLSEGFEDDFDGLKVSDLAKVLRGYTGEVLQVNDHGNMSLYAYSRGRGRELWAIV